MKKVLAGLFILVFAMVLAACGDEGNTSTSNDSGETQNSNGSGATLTWTAGSEGGVWYAGSAGISSLMQEIDDSISFNVIPGGSIQNIHFIENQEADLAWVTPFNGNGAVNGDEPFDFKAENVAAVANGFGAAPFHFLVAADSDIQDLDDLFAGDKLRRIALVTPNTAEDLIIRKIMEFYGTSYDELKDAGYSFFHGSYNEQADELKNHNVEVTIGAFMLPASVTQDTANSREVRLVPVTNPELLEYLAGIGIPESVIPAGTYPEVVNGDEDVPSISMDNMVIAGKHVPEETIYQFVKNLHEIQDKLVNVHAGIGTFTIDKGPLELGSMELHPGAEKYYQEIGVLD